MPAAQSSCDLRPTGEARVRSPATGLANRLEMAMVRAAAAAEHRELRMLRPQRPVLRAKLAGISGIEVRGLVELGMAAPRGVGAQAADALDPGRLRREHARKMLRVCAVDHVVAGRSPRRIIDLRD